MAEEYEKSEPSKTALMPKDFFGDKGLEVGKTCKIRVTHIYEDEAEVEYVSHKDKDDKKEEPEMDVKIDQAAEGYQ